MQWAISFSPLLSVLLVSSVACYESLEEEPLDQEIQEHTKEHYKAFKAFVDEIYKQKSKTKRLEKFKAHLDKAADEFGQYMRQKLHLKHMKHFQRAEYEKRYGKGSGKLRGKKVSPERSGAKHLSRKSGKGSSLYLPTII